MGHLEATYDAGYTTACAFLGAIPIGQSVVLGGGVHIRDVRRYGAHRCEVALVHRVSYVSRTAANASVI